MFYLIAGFICSALVSIVLKISDRKEYDRYGMLAVNYLTCLIPFLISQRNKSFPPFDSDFIFCLLLALINGAMYLTGMAINQMNVKRNGAVLQASFARLGVMVPTCLAIVFFGERPSLLQAEGIIVVLAAFCIMNIRKKNEDEKSAKTKPAFFLLLMGLLFGGLADSMLKVFEEFGSASLDEWFMGLTFISAAIMCIIMTVAGKGKIGKTEIITGMCLGIPNYLSSLFLLKSLSSVSAYIAYPTYSVGAILVVITASTLFFHEKLSAYSRISVLMIIAAIVMLNV